MSSLSNKAEAFLFMEGGSLTLKKLRQLLGADEGSLNAALEELAASLEGSGLSLVVTAHEATLAAAKEEAPALQEAYLRDLDRDIGDAGLEVLSIVLYRGDSTRADVDYIRGVNSSSTIRLLLSRGLLERIGNPEDAREYLYRPTTELLAHLGVRKGSELPEYDAIRAELASFEASQPKPEHDATTHA